VKCVDMGEYYLPVFVFPPLLENRSGIETRRKHKDRQVIFSMSTHFTITNHHPPIPSCTPPSPPLLRDATLQPLDPPTPQPRYVPLPNYVLDPSDGTIQVMALSRRNMAEYQFSERDRGRSRRRDRGPGRIQSSRLRSRRTNRQLVIFDNRVQAQRRPRYPHAQHVSAERDNHIRSCQLPTLWDGKHKSAAPARRTDTSFDGNGRFLCTIGTKP